MKSEWARAYYNQQLARGNKHRAAVWALLQMDSHPVPVLEGRDSLRQKSPPGGAQKAEFSHHTRREIQLSILSGKRWRAF